MPNVDPNRAMYKGLPTFRAGGVTSRIDYFQVDEGRGHKTALAPSYFSHNHFSSSLADAEDPMVKRTRVTVKILEGKNLLVSDLLTGTSDPIALLWVSSSEEGEIDFKCDKRVQSTEVCKRTVDPVWDADFVFPLEIQSVEDIMSGRVNILVRDHDDADGDVHYVDLGRVSVPLETALAEGIIMAHTQLVQLPAKWYPLQRCRGIKKSRGALKIAVGVFFGPDSVLLRDEDIGDTVEQGAGSAARFEHHMKRLRGGGGLNGRDRTVSMSPPRRSPTTSRELTLRGGTTFLRPKSAPEATTLTSPMRLRQRPFELKPIQPPFSPAEVQAARTVQPDIEEWEKMQTPKAGEAETAPASDQRPRWRDAYGSPDRQPDDEKMIPSSVTQEELQDEQSPAGWPVNSPPATASVRPSSKLSRLAATATRGTTGRGRSPGAPVGWDEQESATVRKHRWQRRLIESVQRLEDRSTEGAAYGELRAMVREASSVQVGQVVTAARGVGAACSLSARKYTLRLLAWLCWDQQLASSRYHGGIISFVLDRIRDDETASLRGDLAACVGAVMLSALRNGTADACMVQIRRFLRLVGEQRKSVRESAGACCVASVLPPSPYVPVEVETGLRSIDDVRLAIGQAAERGRTANAVPKEAVLLPGGRAVIELVDAEAAAYFFDRMSATAGGLPSNWSVYPFPEDFCVGVNLAKAAHHARLTVHSEEALASLLEALGNGRSEATRGQLFDAIAAMANSCATYEGDELEPSDVTPKTAAAADGGGLRGIAATLKKGLPAIVRAVLQVLDCPVRRAHTWKERKAALEAIVSLAVLTHLRGAEGPLGEHRAKLIQGSTRGKHDSVAAVRGGASEALVALEATEAEEGKGDCRRPVSAPAGARPLGWGGSGVGTPAAEVRQSLRAGEIRDSACTRQTTKRNKLGGVVMKARRAENDAAEASQREIEHDRVSRKVGGNDGRQGQEEIAMESPQQELTVGPTPSASSAESCSKSSKDSEQDPPQPSQVNIKSSLHVAGGCGSEQSIDHHDTTERRKSTPRVNPEILDTGDPSSVDGVGSTSHEREERHSSEEGISIPRADNVEVGEAEEKEDSVLMPARRPAEPEVKNGPIEAIVATPDPKPLQTVLPTAVHLVRSRAQAIAPQEAKDVVTSSLDTAAGPAALASLPAPMHGGVQVDTFRLLTHLNDKTNSIASVLDGLDQRLLGMERTLVEERPRAADAPIRSPPPRKPKRARSSRTARSEKITPSSRGKPNNASPKRTTDEENSEAAGGTTKTRSARNTTQRLRRHIELLVERGDIERAFRTALSSGTERDVLRLMGSAGGPDLCRHRLGMETRDRFFAFVARTISSGKYAEHALPWVFELVRAGEARGLPLAVRMQLAGALHGLAASPTDQGVMAARLGPYLSLASVGRSSMSDAAEGGGVFSSMGLGGSGE